MGAHTDLRLGLAEAFTVLSEEFHPDAVIELVRASGSYDEYDTVLELEENRFFEFSENGNVVRLEIADDSDALTEAIEQATHLMIDDLPYEIADRSKRSPLSTDVTWVIVAQWSLRDTTIFE